MCREIEYGKCEVCGKEGPLERTYWHYDIKCECHSPNHFEMRRHCKDCAPKEPSETKITFKIEDVKNPTAMAMRVLRHDLRKDKEPGSYYHSWQCNIACAIKDVLPGVDNIHELANKAAENFLSLLTTDWTEEEE